MPAQPFASVSHYRSCFQRLITLAVVCLVAGCASRAYIPAAVDSQPFLQRAVTQDQGRARVTVAVPDAAETLALTGLDLYEQGIQPVWIKVDNQSDKRLRIAPWSIDPNYYSPIEVAYMNRKQFSGEGYQAMERWFYYNGLNRQVMPGQTQSGLVFTKLTPGTKGFNLDIFAEGTAHTLTFFVPMPGFTADYARVDFDNLYTASQIGKLSLEELRELLENDLPCCATDETGQLRGAPFNAVLVASRLALRRSLLRGGWEETTLDDASVSRARTQYYQNRPPDATFKLSKREEGAHMELRVWMAPWQVGDRPVWLVQVGHGIPEDWLQSRVASAQLPEFLNKSVIADLDAGRRFLFQNLWYNHSLLHMGYVPGIPVSTPEQPDSTFAGIQYFTDGLRVVVVLSEDAVALDDGTLIYRDARGR